MEKLKAKIFTRRNIIIALFLVFLFLRVFINSPYSFLGEDNLKYLEVSKNFPYHTLYNDETWTIHGPFYPYVIYFFTFIFQDDFIAAVFINLLSASITFFLAYKLFMLLSKNFYVTFVALLFFSLSVELIIVSHEALKESFVVMLIFASIYFYIKGVKYYDKRSLLFASLFGAFMALTVDYAIFLLPTFVLAYIFFNKEKINFKKFIFPNLKYAIIPFLIILLVHVSWISTKAHQYSTNEYYPAGLNGAPVATEDFGIIQLLNPTYFEDYDPKIVTGFGTSIRKYVHDIGYMFNAIPFNIPRGLNFDSVDYLLFPKHIYYMIILYLPLALFAAFGFLYILWKFIKTKKIYNNANLYLILVFLIFIFPLTQKLSSQRYILTSYILLYYLIGLGTFLFFKKIKVLKIYRKLIPAIIILLLILVPIWYYTNNNFVLFTTKVPANYRTSEFINNNIEKDKAIMTQPGYTVKLMYQTDNRYLGIPPLSENLLPMIDYYDVNYVIFGNFYTIDHYGYAIDSIRFIQEHPEKFELITTIDEPHPDPTRYSKDEVFIYKVVNEKS